MEDKADEQQNDNYRSHYWNNRSNTLERCFYKCLKKHGWNWNRNMSGYIFWYIWQSYFFKKIKINDDTTSSLSDSQQFNIKLIQANMVKVLC